MSEATLFDSMYKGNYILTNCKHDKKSFCKNWDGRGDVGKAMEELECPTKVNPEKPEECEFFCIPRKCQADTAKPIAPVLKAQTPKVAKKKK